jgi:hypothetical protein
MSVEKTSKEAYGCKTIARKAYSVANPDGNPDQQTSLLNKVYRLRELTMHHLVANAVISQASSIQILNLGGGIDDSYCRYSSKQYLVDKESVIKEFSALHESRTSSVIPIICDLNDVDALENLLYQYNFDWNAPTIILLECVISYLQPNSVRQLFSMLATNLPFAILIGYEPICGIDKNNYPPEYYYFRNEMMKKFVERKAPLTYTPSSLPQLLLQCYKTGWKHTFGCNMLQAWTSILPKSQQNISLLSSKEYFDEYTSLLQLCQLYHIYMISTNITWFQSSYQSLFSSNSSSDLLPNTTTSTTLSMTSTTPLSSSSSSIVTITAAHNTDKDRITRLLTRIQLCHLRLSAFSSYLTQQQYEQQHSHISPFSMQDRKPMIRIACREDIEDIIHLLETSYLALISIDKSIRKHIQTSLKKIRDFDRYNNNNNNNAKTSTNPYKNSHYSSLYLN